MDPSLQAETERLRHAWDRHDPAWLGQYLVRDVEDPRRNLQSILTRHFLLSTLQQPEWEPIFQAELDFAAALNWILNPAHGIATPDDRHLLRFGLQTGAANVEGIEIPPFLRRIYSQLPLRIGPVTVPHYLDAWLQRPEPADPDDPHLESVLDTFARLWSQLLEPIPPTGLRVLEPACGSANDARFLDRYGLLRIFDYTGFDLCPANVANARALCPRGRFLEANLFELPFPDRAFDLAFLHDLFEHLSPRALPVAARELCRVVRYGLCLHFFHMDEIPEHVVQPLGPYHWNLLSLDQTWNLFAREGFHGVPIHIGSYLQQRTGSPRTHNPAAYTFLLYRSQP
ncbi:class I SAM-dependent methyltransferase [Limisphaera ngatamarikiensis]|uniref:Class I SAM-dependent methyltransferase n=1 Tax=Limisphaera ngatamarikiensis TaxID=1324935 RepID=A0A6M1RWH6_9BACT|nr:class I SAM-dependent methyltransferase [Limisphaera ngatamarikiensis]NGO39791.1 class I SAM-dependent methyltransferase [Limisphaera ngatamarikiensis]